LRLGTFGVSTRALYGGRAVWTTYFSDLRPFLAFFAYISLIPLQ
jgi:hypothetical protein